MSSSIYASSLHALLIHSFIHLPGVLSIRLLLPPWVWSISAVPVLGSWCVVRHCRLSSMHGFCQNIPGVPSPEQQSQDKTPIAWIAEESLSAGQFVEQGEATRRVQCMNPVCVSARSVTRSGPTLCGCMDGSPTVALQAPLSMEFSKQECWWWWWFSC